ncbi:long-chain-fatty-acid--CoA ligase [Rhodoferax sp.]|uniref:long-chain-fatty-acid--CoA ligase n=1 Tax=Rhodoferax sp. TaxID=50421 RepID=UPI003BB0A9A7
MHLTQGLHRALQQLPDEVASVFLGRRRTFSELGSRVSRLAGGLRNLGVKAGDRVGMLSLNSDRFLEYYLAVYWAGGVVNPVNTRWSPAEIAYSLNDCETLVLIVDDTFLHLIEDLKQRSKVLKTLIHAGDGAAPVDMHSFEGLIADTAPVEDAYRGGGDLAGVFYTGGTTGFPKGVMLSHQGLFTNALIYLAEGLVPRCCVGLHAAPMFHLADGGLMNAMIAGCSTHVIIPKFEPLAVLEAIQAERVTATTLAPTMIQMLTDHPEVERFELDSLTNVVYSASPISEALLERAMKILPSADFNQVYGMTETSVAVTVLAASYHTDKGRDVGKRFSAGRAAVSVDVRVVDALGKEVPRGTAGEVAVRGVGVMQGYWNKPAETAAIVRGGWMHTGDGGRMDEDGFVFIVDRIKDMIVTGGENVYSLEVENAVLKHPAVAMCAVIGVPDEQWGERVHAAIVLKPGTKAAAAEIIEHCKNLIANYKCPREVVFLDAMPLSGAGKILKHQLREPFWQRRDGKIA